MKPYRPALLALISTFGLSHVKAADTVYFLVAELPGMAAHNDSYVLPLSKEEDINHARYLISRWQSGTFDADRPLVVANIVAANDEINRNFLDPKFPKWSWQVSQFLEFGDYTAEVLDGCPACLENRFDWQHFGSGEWGIGFWNYTVVRELGPVPLYLSVVPVVQNLQFYWSGVGTSYVYSLEGKESLASTNWLAIPGASWPLKTHHWTLTLTNAPAPFYRVKAEPANE